MNGKLQYCEYNNSLEGVHAHAINTRPSFLPRGAGSETGLYMPAMDSRYIVYLHQIHSTIGSPNLIGLPCTSTPGFSQNTRMTDSSGQFTSESLPDVQTVNEGGK